MDTWIYESFNYYKLVVLKNQEDKRQTDRQKERDRKREMKIKKVHLETTSKRPTHPYGKKPSPPPPSYLTAGNLNKLFVCLFRV